MDRQGRLIAEFAPPAPYRGFALSPDRRLLAFSQLAGTKPEDLWAFDLVRRTLMRLTFDGGEFPIWSPDGRAIVFTDAAGSALYRVRVDGSARKELLFKVNSPAPLRPTDWSRDG